jgi:hypothetical protein
MPTPGLRAIVLIAVMQQVLTAPALAEAPKQPGEPGAAAVLFACRSIADDAQRLACYDREVGALQQAEAADKVVIVNQEEIREARRGLFGFTLPKLGLFSGRGDDDDAEAEEIRAIEDTIATFRFDAAGRATFSLGNGARWAQIDNTAVLGEPKPGDPVRIESAALGSYKASIGGRRPIRVKRLN